MADNLLPARRSYNMSRIRSSDTKPEKLVRSKLFKAGFRFRKNVSTLAGRPDIVLPKFRTVIFVHGCFWHGHEDCAAFRLPKSNTEFWAKKIFGNVKRDRDVLRTLGEAGWHCIVIWECSVLSKNEFYFESVLNEIRSRNAGKIG